MEGSKTILTRDEDDAKELHDRRGRKEYRGETALPKQHFGFDTRTNVSAPRTFCLGSFLERQCARRPSPNRMVQHRNREQECGRGQPAWPNLSSVL